MTIRSLLLTTLLVPLGIAAMLLGGCGEDSMLSPSKEVGTEASGAITNHYAHHGKIVIANRGSGTISVLEARSGDLIGTYDLPADPNPAEPMYVVYVRRTNGVVVGDRANDQVVEFDADDFSVRRTAPTGRGVFHMWVDPVHNRQLWVNNDIDNTTTVIDPVTFDVLATVEMPADLVAMGGKPHDVILNPLGRDAYVSMVGFAGANDYVIHYSTRTFDELHRAAVGKDPHLSLTQRNRRLYVPCQESDVVLVFNRTNLSPVTEIPLPGAHGVGMTRSGRILYTTNLTGGGTDGLYAIDTRQNQVVGDPVDTPYGVPHNIAVTSNGRRLFVTHSGPTADKVSFYSISPAQPAPVLMGEVTVGTNPFGLAYVP